MGYFLTIKFIIAVFVISLSANTAFGHSLEIICSAPDRKPLERILGENVDLYMVDEVHIHPDRTIFHQGSYVRETKENDFEYTYPGCCRFRFQYLPDQKKMKFTLYLGMGVDGRRLPPAYYNQCIDLKETSNSQVKKHVESEPNILRSAFKDLSEYQRKKAQKILTMYGFYNSKVDGLYGKGTEKALKGYNKKFLGNSDLSKDLDVANLLDRILEDTTTEAQENLNKKSKVTSNQNTSEVDITVQDLKTAFNEQKFEVAMEMASTLSQRGEAEAFFYLGKMFAEGLGTLQLSKNAHMWFNIAAMNGISGAADARKKIADGLTSEAVDDAQMLAIKCIESKYTNCGFMPFD